MSGSSKLRPYTTSPSERFGERGAPGFPVTPLHQVMVSSCHFRFFVFLSKTPPSHVPPFSGHYDSSAFSSETRNRGGWGQPSGARRPCCPGGLPPHVHPRVRRPEGRDARSLPGRGRKVSSLPEHPSPAQKVPGSPSPGTPAFPRAQALAGLRAADLLRSQDRPQAALVLGEGRGWGGGVVCGRGSCPRPRPRVRSPRVLGK